MRVAFCIDNLNVGGTELNAVRTAERLVGAGVDLCVFHFAPGGPLLERYRALGIPLMELPIDGLLGRSAWKAGRALARVVREQRIDVVHTHDIYSNIVAAPWARLAGAAVLASRRWWEGPDRLSQRAANRVSYLFASRVLANSESIASLLVSEHIPRARVATIPNFLDESAFAPPPAGWRDAVRAELALPPDAPVIGVVASLQPIKDHALLIRAVAQCGDRQPRLHMVLAGADYGVLAALQALASELGVADRLRFAGLRPNQPSFHHLFDISALTSVSEGLPNSVLEAMAAGRPVIATRVGAVADAVADGESGFLVPARDAAAFSARIVTLLADDRRRAAMGAAGRSIALDRYSADAVVARLITVYTELAAGRSGATRAA